MNMATPTDDGVSAAAPAAPDEATLTRLANEFFGAMPGHEPLPAGAAGPPSLSPAQHQPPGARPATQPLDELSEYHRAASLPGRLAAAAAPPSPFAVPGLSPATATP